VLAGVYTSLLRTTTGGFLELHVPGKTSYLSRMVAKFTLEPALRSVRSLKKVKKP
jgi:hypothetical protein